MLRRFAGVIVTASLVLLGGCCGGGGDDQKEPTVANLVGYWQMPYLPNGFWRNGTGEVMWLQASGRYEQSTGSSIHIVKGGWTIKGQTIEFLEDKNPNGARVMQVESFTGDEMVISGSMVWENKSMKIKRYDRCPAGITPNMAHQVEFTDPLEVISKNFSYDGYLSGDIDSDGELHAVLTTAGDFGSNSRYVTSRADGCGLLQYKVPAVSYSSMAIDASDRMHLGYAGLPDNPNSMTKTVTLSYATRNAKDLQAPWEVTRLETNAETVPVVDMAVTPQGDVVLVATGDGKTLQAWRKPAGSDKWSKSPIRDKFDGAFSLALDGKGKAHVATAEWGEPGQPYKLTVYSETAADQSGWQSEVLDTAGTQQDYQGRVPEVDIAIGPGDEWAVISGAKGNSLQVKDGSVALGRGKQGALKWSIIGSGGKAKVVFDALGRLHALFMPAVPVALFYPQRALIHVIYDGTKETRYVTGGHVGEANDAAPYRIPLLAAGPAGEVVIGTFIDVFILPAPGKSPAVLAEPNVKSTLKIQPASGGVDTGVTVRIPELGVACTKTCEFTGPVGPMVEVTFEGSKYWKPKVERDHAGRTWLQLSQGQTIMNQYVGPYMEISFVWSPVDKAQVLTQPQDGWDSASAQLPAAMPSLDLPIARSIGGQPAARLMRWDAKDKPLPNIDFSDWKPLAFSPVVGGGWWAVGIAYNGSTVAGQSLPAIPTCWAGSTRRARRPRSLRCRGSLAASRCGSRPTAVAWRCRTARRSSAGTKTASPCRRCRLRVLRSPIRKAACWSGSAAKRRAPSGASMARGR
jgi:hypothetical protein